MGFSRFGDRLAAPPCWRLPIALLAPMGAIAGAAATCWLIWVTLNSPASAPLKFAAARLTFLLTYVVLWLIVPFVARAADQRDAPTTSLH